MTEEYSCKCCDYSTQFKSNFAKHNKTEKHLKKQEIFDLKKGQKICDNCNQKFNSRTTLWRHKKECKAIVSQAKEQNVVIAKKDLFDLIAVISNNTNNTNNTNNNSDNQTTHHFNLKTFLHETFKNAITLDEFLE